MMCKTAHYTLRKTIISIYPAYVNVFREIYKRCASIHIIYYNRNLRELLTQVKVERILLFGFSIKTCGCVPHLQCRRLV